MRTTMRNARAIQAARKLFQKLDLETERRIALGEAERSGDEERIRLAREALDHAGLAVNEAVLDHRDTLAEDVLAYIEDMKVMQYPPPQKVS